MPLTSDVANDHLSFDGGATVTLNQIRAGVSTPVTVRNATNRGLSWKQMMALSGVELSGKERSWNLMASDVGAGGVETGDTINDGTDTWYVISATLTGLGSRWKCVCSRNP